MNRLLPLTARQRRQGVVTASAGNHGQGVAYHAARLGIPAEVWMPRARPLVKVTATRRYRAEVVLHGNSYDEACEAAIQRCKEKKAIFLHAFDDLDVIAGQGPIGLEMLRQSPNLNAIVVPVGGGGLIGGVACAVRSRRPEIQVIGVQAARLPSMQAALERNEPVRVEPSANLADGIAVRKVGVHGLRLVREYVDQIVTVDEEEIAAAVLILLEREKTVVEGAGAAGIAALVNGKTALRGKNVGVVISGGNLDVTGLSRIIERGLVKDGRRLRLRVRLPDYPGALERLAATIARSDTNIVETLYNRAHYGVSLEEIAIDVTMETRGREHVAELLADLENANYPFSRVE